MHYKSYKPGIYHTTILLLTKPKSVLILAKQFQLRDNFFCYNIKMKKRFAKKAIIDIHKPL